MKFFLKIVFFIFLISLHYHQYIKCSKVALCTVATGKNARFVKNLVETARKNFLPGHQIAIYVFTDQLLPVEGDDLVIIDWPHKPEPYASLMQFNAYSSIAEQFKGFDYIFACDASTFFIDVINSKILTKRFGLLQSSQDKLDLEQAEYLYDTSFYGGETQEFFRLVFDCKNKIQQNLKQGIANASDDKKYLNYFFLKNPPDISLPFSSYLDQDGIDTFKATLKKDDNIKMNRAKHPLSDREFVILIPSYNNILYYKKNLDSVYKQNYGKYRVIYVDDNSPDGTGKAVEKYVHESGKAAITTIIKNDERKLAMANIYHAIHQHCYDHEIVVMLDGDDELVTPDALSYLNDIYTKDDIWFTYGNIWFPSLNQLGPWSKKIDDAQIELNRFREWNGAATHLRTFGAWLFKLIKKNDLQLDGVFFKMTYDVAMFMPILEMAGYHHRFIQRAMYIYNDQNPISDHRVDSKLQIDLDKYIRTQLDKYKPLSKLAYFSKILTIDESLNLQSIQLAALLDDLLAEIFNTYCEKSHIEFILKRIPVFQNKLINKVALLQISHDHQYLFLKNYLS